MIKDNNALLTACNIDVYLGKHKILENISLDARSGEFIGIIGPNGAGKSTLLRSLRGLIPISSGEILVDDKNIKKLTDKDIALKAAYMQQNVNVSFGYTALEVVLAGRYPYLNWWEKESKKDYEIARKYLEYTGVKDLENTKVQNVSGGQRQRILLAKVLAQETPLIFLDEPTASLDIKYQEEIFTYCKQLCCSNKTVLLVAHDIRLAARYCSRLLLVADGQIIADGTPSEVITADNLQKAYGINANVFISHVTGDLDIYTYAAASFKRKARVHIIGGGGAGSEMMRAMHEAGFQLTVGVLSQGDSDTAVAEVFGIDNIVTKPFSAIDEITMRHCRESIGTADYAVLTNIFYGEQNIDNLKAAHFAKHLFVLEDTPISERDFTGGKVTKLYNALISKSNVTVMTSEEFLKRYII